MEKSWEYILILPKSKEKVEMRLRGLHFDHLEFSCVAHFSCIPFGGYSLLSYETEQEYADTQECYFCGKLTK